MFDKFFGFLRSHDEETILTSIVDHSKIDEEELMVLFQMTKVLTNDEAGDLETMYKQICTINAENSRIFESVSDHIIQSNFDFQKQYDLLRLQQRIDVISSLIIATSKRIIIFNNINGVFPKELYIPFKQLNDMVIQSHQTFVLALQKFKESRKGIIELIHQAVEEENVIDNIRSECVEIIYNQANLKKLRPGDMLALEGIIEYLEEISDAIKSAITSIDWLLINH